VEITPPLPYTSRGGWQGENLSQKIENLNASSGENHLITSLGSLLLNLDNTLKAGGDLTVQIVNLPAQRAGLQKT
jgi:hypothetical protein